MIRRTPANEFFFYEPQLGYETNEPHLCKIIQEYYGAHFPVEEAETLTEQYMQAMMDESLRRMQRLAERYRLVESDPNAASTQK